MVTSALIEQSIALAHTVPDAELLLTLAGGRQLRLRSDSVGDARPRYTPCTLRALLLQSRSAGRELSSDIRAISLAGSLRDVGGGIHARSAPEGTELWFATRLAPDAVARVLRQCSPEPPDGAIGARIAGDRQLAVSTVAIRATHPAYDELAEDVAQWAFAVCVVDEVAEPVSEGWATVSHSS